VPGSGRSPPRAYVCVSGRAPEENEVDATVAPA
jgi:hypothetical protein